MISDNNYRSASSLTPGAKSSMGQGMYVQSEDSIGQQMECHTCRRSYEAFCTVCYVLVCPTCVMFGAHKGHNVCPMDEASKDIRKQMDEAAKIGILKLEKTENVLVDIRHTKLTCEEAKQRALKEVENTFQAIFKIIKQRKDDIVREINNHFETQINLITESEKFWVDKQERAYDLVKLGKQPNDYQLIEKATYIIESLNLLKQSPAYKNVHIVNSVDSNFSAVSGSQPQTSVHLNLAEFKKSLEKWMKLGDPVLIQFKC